jgi:enoyl-CoA hydratase
MVLGLDGGNKWTWAENYVRAHAHSCPDQSGGYGSTDSRTEAYHDFGNDPSLRAAVFFGHGENFSRGIDVDAFAPLAKTGKPFAIKDGMLDPFARTQKLSKPLIAVVHGDTWNMGHELASGGRHPGGQRRRAVRPGREHARTVPRRRLDHPVPAGSGMGNAMRYMLTGDHWGAEEAHRMGVIHQIAACGPLGIKTTLESAYFSIVRSGGVRQAR